MIRDISIQNFRCFEDTSISGFKTVNLITGRNNAGKTALLETLLLGNSPRPEIITSLKKHRRESSEFDKTLPEKTWDNFFYNQDNSKNISINVIYDDKSSKLCISVDHESLKSFMEADETGKDYRYADLLSNTESTISALKLNMSINDKDCFESNLISTAKGIVGRSPKLPDLTNVYFIPASVLRTNRELTAEYDKARFNNREQEVINIFQIVDPSIQFVESFSVGSPMLYLQREKEKRLPLSLFGDAINRVANIILSVINNNSSILLIDEIENGIHYTNHVSLWKMLFKLSQELNVQIFATTHSLEMLTAFTKVGLESEFSDLAAHFEMARSVKTGQIIGIKRDMETLEYSLSHNRGVRGE